MKPRTQGIIGITSAQAILGTLGVCVIESGVDSISVVFYRCAIGAILLALYCYWREDLWNIRKLPTKTIALALLSGALVITNWTLFFEGIQRTSITTATIVFLVQPFFVVILGAVIFRERIRAMTFVWVTAAFVGLTLATGISFSGGDITSSFMIGLGFCGLRLCLRHNHRQKPNRDKVASADAYPMCVWWDATFLHITHGPWGNIKQPMGMAFCDWRGSHWRRLYSALWRATEALDADYRSFVICLSHERHSC